MTEELAGMGIAVIVVTASIVLAGILIGLGRAFSYKRVEYFGIEELIQSIINAAIIGSVAAIISFVGAVSSSVVTDACTEGNIVDQLLCTLGLINTSLFALFQELASILNLLGYYQSLSLDFGVFSISPFLNLSSISNVLSLQLLMLNILMILIGLNVQIALFIKQNVLALMFPVGLVLRTLFATRKVGGFLIALALGLYIFYPTFVLVFPNPQAGINESTQVMQNFTNNSYYAAMPIIDLNDNYAIAGKLDVLSGRCIPYSPPQNFSNMSNTTNLTACQNFTIAQNLSENSTVDFTGDLTVIAQSNTVAISKSLLYTVIAPLFSLLITIVFVRELGTLLGSEVGFRTVASI